MERVVVGQKVKLLNAAFGGLIVGQTYTVSAIAPHGINFRVAEMIWHHENDFPCSPQFWEPAPERVLLPNGFAVGDRIFYEDNIRNIVNRSYGTVIDVTKDYPKFNGMPHENNEINVWATWDHNKGGLNPWGFMPKDRVFLVDDQNGIVEGNKDMPIVKREWKIGDRVRITVLPHDARLNHGPQIGAEGKIIRLGPDGAGQRHVIEFDKDIGFGKGHMSWHTEPKCFELIEEEPVQAVLDKAVTFLFASKGGKYYEKGEFFTIEAAQARRDILRDAHNNGDIYSYVMTEII